MVPSLPYAEYDIPWEGEGPSMGAGGADSDPRYGGEQMMVATNVSLQYVYGIVPPKINTAIDFAGPALYPPDAENYALAALPNTAITVYLNQDTVPGGIVGEDYPADITLQAPPVVLGGTMTRGA